MKPEERPLKPKEQADTTFLNQPIVSLGAGRMGRGIALAFAYAGFKVDVVDFKQRSNEAWLGLQAEALAELRSSLRMLAELGAMDAVAGTGADPGGLVALAGTKVEQVIDCILQRVRMVRLEESETSLRQARLVFEAVPETLEAKRDALHRLCLQCSNEAIIASTTSTILVTDLIAMVTHPGRLLNAHWLNPAYVVPLVEISAHAGTSTLVVAKLKALLEAIGKVPMVCGPAPGFIVPRLQALIMNEAARMVEEGIATPEEIDKATRFGLGFRFAALGVVEFIDYGGNDILYHASRYLAQALSPERYTSPEIVNRLMLEGRNGLKDGRGFYDYDKVDVAAYRKDALSRSLGMLKHLGLQRPPVI
jgi:3-hydroxybutyryl-CoA dehydrogenase